MNRHSECVLLISCYGNLSHRQRRNACCVSCSHPNKAIDPLFFSPTPTAHPEMDIHRVFQSGTTTSRDPTAGSARGSCLPSIRSAWHLNHLSSHLGWVTSRVPKSGLSATTPLEKCLKSVRYQTTSYFYFHR